MIAVGRDIWRSCNCFLSLLLYSVQKNQEQKIQYKTNKQNEVINTIRMHKGWSKEDEKLERIGKEKKKYWAVECSLSHFYMHK